jgi:DNA-binding NarL/FixJ family response regulator
MNILLADNQDITRLGMHYIVRMALDKSQYDEIADVRTHKDLMSWLQKEEQAVVIIDLTLFDMHNADELLNMSSRFSHVHWIMFSDNLTEGLIRRLSVEPSFSMVLKDSSAQEIQTAVQCAVRGERYLGHQITNILLTSQAEADKQDKLTHTETEILKLIAAGKTVKEIANERCSSNHTIITHKKNIFRKLNVNTTYEATKWAIKNGVVNFVEYYI